MTANKLAEKAMNILNERIVRIVFDIIEWDTELSADYDTVLAGMKKCKNPEMTLNSRISQAVAKAYGLKVGGVTRASLIKTYSKLKKVED